jgi:hypothetical protein
LTVLINHIQHQFPSYITDEISEGWLYWPLTHGGLGLRNIYLDLYSFHNTFQYNLQTTFTELTENDLRIYTDLKDKNEQSKKYSYSMFSLDLSYKFVEQYVDYNKKFMIYDEFIAERETHLIYWADVYRNMLKLTEPVLPEETDTLARQMQIFDHETRASSRVNRHFRQQDCRDSSYLQWLVCYYGEQIESTFQQLDFIDSDSIPIGLIRIIKTSDINWDKESK